MASLIDRFRHPRAEDTADDAAEKSAADETAQRAPRRRPLPSGGRLRRERRSLLRLREQQIRDLGGLVLEMYRLDRFRQDVIYEQAAEIVAVEERLREVDELLFAVSNRRSTAANRCDQCGTPLYAGARFCPGCGRPVTVEQA
jgi:NADH pyrophosphatase NudC (nudix superfamily)